MTRPPWEVADIIRRAGDKFIERHRGSLTWAQLKVLRAIECCRSAALGGHRDQCVRCGHQAISYNSCRNRHCPKCQTNAREKWLCARRRELLPVCYFHLVFSVPHALVPMVWQNKILLFGLLFDASAATLLEVAADPARLGAEIGFLSILHTGGQTLQRHPHIHCVVPGGGLSLDHSRWIRSPPHFFLPVRVLSRVFRGKFVAGLRRAFHSKLLVFHGELQPLANEKAFAAFLRTLFREDWVVYAKAPFGGPEHVLQYLARYTHRVAISNHRLLSVDGDRVTFRWKDYAHHSKCRAMTLTLEEFLRRFLQHVLPKGLPRIRYFGWLANRRRRASLPLCRMLLAVAPPSAVTNDRMPGSRIGLSRGTKRRIWTMGGAKIRHGDLTSTEGPQPGSRSTAGATLPTLTPLVYDTFCIKRSVFRRGMHAPAGTRRRPAGLKVRDRPELGPESAAIDAALAAWRRKAADILMAVNAAVHLPAVIIVALGHGPPAGSLAKAVAFAVYLALAAAALLRQIRQRTRLLASFFALYLVTAVANLAALRGPYAQVGLVVYPVLVLVFLGAPAARIAVLASATILVSAPFLRVLPVVVRMLAPPARLAEPPDVVWMQAAGLVAFLAAVMIVLDRFHRFLLDALGAQCRAMAERQRLEREIAAIGDRERRRLGQELHDGVCQQVTAALLRCQALERRLDRGGTLSGADFAPLSSLLGDTIDDAHNVARGLCPLEPHPDSLAPALRAMTKRMQEVAAVPCEFRAVGDVRVSDPEAAQHLYRIAQEAVSNSVRHAKPGRITVELRSSNGELTLRIEDDGAGMPAAIPGDCMGLRTMAYRAQIINGELTVDPARGGGTRVVCHVPLAAGALATGRHE